MCLHDTTQQGVWIAVPSLSTATWTQHPSTMESPHFTYRKLCHVYQVVTYNPLFLCRMLKKWARSLSVLPYKYASTLKWKDSVQDEELVLWNVKSLPFLLKSTEAHLVPVICFHRHLSTWSPPENPIAHWQHDSKLAIWGLKSWHCLSPATTSASVFSLFFNVLRTNKAASYTPWVSEPFSPQVLCQTEMLTRQHSD